MLLVPNAPVRVLHRWVTVPSGSTRHTLASVVSVHTACAVAIRAGGVLVGAVGHRGAGRARVLCRPGLTEELVVSTSSDAVQRRWTDPRSRVPRLPRSDPADALLRCRQTVRGRAVVYG